MKKFLLPLFLAALLIFSTFAMTSGAAFLGTGADVLANGVTLIKTGLLGTAIKFTDSDFKSER